MAAVQRLAGSVTVTGPAAASERTGKVGAEIKNPVCTPRRQKPQPG